MFSGEQTRKLWVQRLILGVVLIGPAIATWIVTADEHPIESTPFSAEPQGSLESVQKMHPVGGSANACKCSMRIEPE